MQGTRLRFSECKLKTGKVISMSTVATELQATHATRVRSLVWPREHGAWGILLVPLLTGGCVGLLYGQNLGLLALFMVTAVAHFCLRTPFEAWLGNSPMRAHTEDEHQAVLLSMIVYATIGDVALLVLLLAGHAYGLLVLGAVAVAMFFAQPLLREMGRRMRLVAQLIGCVGLTSAAPAAYYVTTGQLDSRAFVLWAVNWLFVANQVQFVHLRIRTARIADFATKFARGQTFLMAEFLTVLALALAWRAELLPGLGALAFAPILVRGVTWFFPPPAPLDVHRLGVSELLHAVFFGVLLTLSYAAGHLQV